MKTDDLVTALVADRASPVRTIPRGLVAALAAGGIVSLAILLGAFGVREDIAAALASWRFELKLVMVVLALVLAFGLCREASRPVSARDAPRRLLLLGALAAIAVVIELSSVPVGSWGQRLIGTNASICLTAIPLLSLAPLIAVLVILRSGAPASPVFAGAAAGFLAAAAGASLYALHCFDDSPLFVVTWYVLAALPVIAVGALAGRWVLRW